MLKIKSSFILVLFFLLNTSHASCVWNLAGLPAYCANQNRSPTFISCPNDTPGVIRAGCRYQDDTSDIVNLQRTCQFASPLISLNQMICTGEPPTKAQKHLSPDNSCRLKGSIINPDTLTFMEEVKIVGTKFSLFYSSEKVKGRKDSYTARIPLNGTGSAPPSTITNTKLEMKILDRTINSDHVPSKGSVAETVWDGKDSTGSEVEGAHVVTYSVVDDHGMICGTPIPPVFSSDYQTAPILHYGGPSSCGYLIPTISSMVLGSIFKTSSLIGGWNFGVRHHYDRLRKVLHLGDGSNFNTQYIEKPNGNFWILSQDRSQIFVFTSDFRHIQTLNSKTGLVELHFNYNSNSNLSEIVDKYGNSTSIQYSGSNPVSITSPYGQVTNIVVDTNGYISTITSPMNESHNMTYDAEGLMLSFEMPSGTNAILQYNQDGTLLSDTSSSGASITFQKIMTASGFTMTETSNLGRVKNYTVSKNGDAYTRSTKYPDTRNVVMDSNQLSKYLSIGDQGGRSTGYFFNDDLRFANVKKLYSISIQDLFQNMNVTIGEAVTLSNQNDPFSFNTYTTSETMASKTWTNVFNKNLNSSTLTTPMLKTVSLSYNSLGDIQSFQRFSFTPYVFSYDSKGNVVEISQSNARKTIYSYDSHGNLSSIEDPLGQIKSFSYDLSGKLLTTTSPDGRVVSYRYDLNGNVTGVTPPSKPEHVFSYNEFDYIDSYNPPLIVPSSNYATTYLYSNDREILEINRPNGQSADFNYDPLKGSLTTITLPNGIRSFTYSLDRPMQMNSEDGINRYIQYSGNKPYSVQTTIGSFSDTVTQNYNNKALMSSEQLVRGTFNHTLNYIYDDDNLLTTAGSEILTRSVNTGLITQIALGDVTQNFTYSADFGELSGMQARFNGNLVFEVNYVRDNLGRVLSKTVQYPGAPLEEYDYSYDLAGRLTSVVINNMTSRTYGYDSNSNRTSAPGASVIAYDLQDKLQQYGNKSYSFDLNGDLVSISDSSTSEVSTFTYDVFGNLKSVHLPSKTVNYLVDTSNRRVVKKNASSISEYYIWNDQNQLIATANGLGILEARFVYGSKAHTPDYMIKGSNEYQIVSDQLGSPVLIINKVTGMVVQEIKYDEFGNVLSDSYPGFTPFGFAGCLYDQDTKLCRFGARDYDASIGRWLSKDPILFAAGDTNLYGYVLQDPINWIDPTGLYNNPADDGTTQHPSLKDEPGLESPLIDPTDLLIGGAAAKLGFQGGSALAWEAFRKNGFLNSNRYLRIGFSRHGGDRVFRAAGEWVPTSNNHLTLKNLGPLQKVNRCE